MRAALLRGALLLTACGWAEACEPDLSVTEQGVECDDGDPSTVDRCAPPGACTHEARECDPGDDPGAVALACGGDPCLAWRCLYDPTDGGRCVPLGPIGNCP